MLLILEMFHEVTESSSQSKTEMMETSLAMMDDQTHVTLKMALHELVEMKLTQTPAQKSVEMAHQLLTH